MHVITTMTHTTSNLHAEVVIDEHPWSPRTDMDNLGFIIVESRDWNLGDSHHYPLRDMIEVEWGDVTAVGARIAEDVGARVAYALELREDRYIGAQLSIITDTDPDPERVAGYIMDTDASRRIMGLEDATDETLRESLEAEVSLYNEYLRGDVFGIIVYDEDEMLDSVWGVYGEEYALAEADNLLDEQDRGRRHESLWRVVTETYVRAATEAEALERVSEYRYSGDRRSESKATKVAELSEG